MYKLKDFFQNKYKSYLMKIDKNKKNINVFSQR